MVLIINLLGPSRGVGKIFICQIFSKIFFSKIFLLFWPLYSQKLKILSWPPVLHFFSRFQNFFQNSKIPTTANVATQNVCTHATFTILNLHSMSFLTPLQSKFDIFEWTSSVAFFVKISELFSKPENSNYSRRGDPKRMRACHIYNPKLILNVVFDPLAVKIRKFWNDLQQVFWLRLYQ